MIFYQLENIDKMLDATSDPIADFINASCSDTIQFCSGLTYEEFVNSSGDMNELSTYGQLIERATAIGYKVKKNFAEGNRGLKKFSLCLNSGGLRGKREDGNPKAQ